MGRDVQEAMAMGQAMYPQSQPGAGAAPGGEGPSGGANPADNVVDAEFKDSEDTPKP